MLTDGKNNQEVPGVNTKPSYEEGGTRGLNGHGKIQLKKFKKANAKGD